MSERSFSHGRWPRLISGVGVLYGVVLIGELVVWVSQPTPPSLMFWAGLVTSLPFILGLVYGGYWLAQSDLGADQYSRIGRWWAASSLTAMVIIFPLNATVQPIPPRMAVGTLRWSGAIGGSVGLALGTFQARAIAHERLNERARMQFDTTRNEEDLLVSLGDLYADAITPLVSKIAEEVAQTSPDNEQLRRHARQLATITRHVDTMLSTDEIESRAGAVDLTEAIQTAAANLDAERPGTAITIARGADEGPGPFVRANAALDRLFLEVFDALCAASEPSGDDLAVWVDQDGDTVEVRITGQAIDLGDGPSGFGGARQSPYTSEVELVEMLVEFYGGSLEVEAQEGEAVITIELKRVPIEERASVGSEPSKFADGQHVSG